MNRHLLIVDPQNDFCDPKRGALYVRGAEGDMQALAEFIHQQGALLDAIHITLDSHHSLHIAHPIFWQDPKGRHPAPFTTITRQEVESGKWSTTNPDWQARGVAYVQALERNQRYQLMIWPPHCRIGSWGHSIFPVVSDALFAWEERFFRKVNFLMKGSNVFTEHYSVVVADVPDETDESTKLSTRFIRTLLTADQILLSGEALSHCVANTVTDVANYSGTAILKKFVLLRNTTSSVSGCEALGEQFLQHLGQRGMQITTTGEVENQLGRLVARV